MKIELYEENQAICMEDIKDFEDKMHISLPKDYIAFMLCQNGGNPKVCEFELPDKSNWSVVNEFYPIGSMENNLYKMNYLEDYSDGFIAIGDDSCGNEILLKVNGENIGEIYFYDHDVDPEEENNMHYLAKSLTDFLKLLK